MGGRPGYPDERHHGRFAGRSSGGYRGGQSHLYFTLLAISGHVKRAVFLLFKVLTFILSNM